jgi:sugar diacid utilization regulator
MYRRLRLHEESQERAADLVRSLISSEPADRARGLDRLAEDDLVLSADPTVAVVAKFAGRVSDSEDVHADLQAAIEMATGDLARASIAWLRPVDAVLLLFGGGGSAARRVAERIASRMIAVDHRVVVGIGGEETGADGAATSHADATLAARAATLLPELGTVVSAESLGVYRLLLKLPPEELAEARYPAELRRLIDADSNDNLVDTLAEYLACGGDVTSASAALHVHRSTLYYRLGRIEEIAGVDLRDGSQRLWLHLGLKMRELNERL